MKIGDKVRCLTSIFFRPAYGEIGVIEEIKEKNILLVNFPSLNISIYMRDFEVEVVE